MTANNLRIDLINERLTTALAPQELSIIDESHLHADHPGAQESGGGHFNIEIVSDSFNNQSQVERHKLIYMALGDIMGTEIHALSINALTTNEANHDLPSDSDNTEQETPL